MYSNQLRRQQILESRLSSPRVIEELLDYGRNKFQLPEHPLVLPLPDEAHVVDWRAYATVEPTELFANLQSKLPQLLLPIRVGISATEEYRAVMRSGKSPASYEFYGSLQLHSPASLQLSFADSIGGCLPVLETTVREDFETLCQALIHRNEPVEIHPATNAQMVTGLLNWDRLHQYRRRLQGTFEGGPGWSVEMSRVAQKEKWRCFDRVILLCRAPYGGRVRGDDGHEENQWLIKSSTIRLQHELTHYFTLRLFGHMSPVLFDELICDWAGFVAAYDEFEAKLFLDCLGIQEDGTVRPGGRAWAYRSNLSDEAFLAACELTVLAGTKLQELTTRLRLSGEPQRRMLTLLALTQMSLEESSDCCCMEFFEEQVARVESVLNRTS